MNQIEQAKRIEKLERQVMLLKAATDHDAMAIDKLQERIVKLERRVASLAAEAVPNLSIASVEQRERIERLEAALGLE